MKLSSLVLASLAVSLSVLGACAPASEPAQPASAAPVAPAGSAATPDALAPAPTPAAATSPASNPANARNAGKRYEGGIEKLDSSYDLSKVQLDSGAQPAAAAHDEHDGHDHDAHDHAAESNPAVQVANQYSPAGQAERNKGRFQLDGDAPQVKDLGKLRQGDTGAFDFPFVSAGEEALVITGVKPSCGCTKSEIVLVDADGTRRPYTKGDPIAPGQKFLLESEVSTDGKPGGPFNATIALYGNDVRGAFNVRLTAEIEPVLTISPSQQVFFGRITTAQKVDQSVTVSATRGEPFLLTLAQENPPEPVKLEFAPKNPDADGRSNEWEIKIALGPNAKIGMNNYPLSFKSDIPIAHPKYPSADGSPQNHGFMVNVQAQVTGMISAEPSFLTFGMVRPGEPVERSLRIQSHDEFVLKADIPFTLEGLQGQEFPFQNAFQVTVEPLEGGKEADLKVRLTGLPEDLNGSFGGQIKLKVGHPFMDELLIRFSGVCRPGLPIANGQQTPPVVQPH